ncbi:MAG TPA: aminomethyltransferase family protein [Verrucomicrobiae bacterium]|jgi:folate-binding protein YgfZ|nr:aminomethyltransferase family protein [Verrucomicrobiae bacterium]
MNPLALHDFHAARGARFFDLNGHEAVMDYGDWRAEYAALRETAGLIDLSFRGRLCALGKDAQKFLHGQVTNHVNGLQIGQGCYAALVSAKGKMQSDLNIYRLENEWLLDFEPGLGAVVKERLEKYVIAEEVEIVDAAAAYGLVRAQGPEAGAVAEKLGVELPREPRQIVSVKHAAWGDLYLTKRDGFFEFFVPTAALPDLAKTLAAPWCGWQALEAARIEDTVPRYGADMDETNLPPEAGLDNRAVSYAKGCYIGQEVIARIRTYGQVAKTLRGLTLSSAALPARGARLWRNDKEVGYITSATESPKLKAPIALGYVRREANAIGTDLQVEIAGEKVAARVATLPFEAF